MIRLLCFPYAGGSALAYFNLWKDYIHPNIELIPVEIAGRGLRCQEPFYRSFTDALDDMYQSILPVIRKGPYALLGHSLGAVFAYEMYRKIQSENGMLPCHLFFSASTAPDFWKKEKEIYSIADVSNEQLIQTIIQLGGTPVEIMSNPKFMNHFLAILRADFQLISTYTQSKNRSLFNCDVTALYGRHDRLVPDEILAWSKYTALQFRHFSFEGGHFYINHQIIAVSEVINAILEPMAEKVELS